MYPLREWLLDHTQCCNNNNNNNNNNLSSRNSSSRSSQQQQQQEDAYSLMAGVGTGSSGSVLGSDSGCIAIITRPLTHALSYHVTPYYTHPLEHSHPLKYILSHPHHLKHTHPHPLKHTHPPLFLIHPPTTRSHTLKHPLSTTFTNTHPQTHPLTYPRPLSLPLGPPCEVTVAELLQLLKDFSVMYRPEEIAELVTDLGVFPSSIVKPRNRSQTFQDTFTDSVFAQVGWLVGDTPSPSPPPLPVYSRRKQPIKQPVKQPHSNLYITACHCLSLSLPSLRWTWVKKKS